MGKYATACGKVISKKQDGKVVVALTPSVGCGNCKSKESCATAHGKSHHFELQTDMNVKVGDMVEIGIPKKSVYTNGLLVYIMPVIMLFLGALLGTVLDKNFATNFATPLFSISFLVIYFIILKLLTKNKENKLIIIKILS
ncbi:SoxR reducing system RseC family protein [Deferribacter autotrophicus]|uniref:SoxR reducing system RseC family protein n=1 Tax=Deferribacter autotrophicus TaxID=500465 RepID=A0A5A8F5U7_9BACT|nr:SoxR reducing system RseC family protein [Deferribacter autotrophicus]KAA0258823.1 SoxR reducing system RseC family protein [Deferribacter autotrophicus]